MVTIPKPNKIEFEKYLDKWEKEYLFGVEK